MTETVQIRLKPSLLAAESFKVTAAGTTIQLKSILTSTAIYLHEPSLTSELGKPWVKIDLSALSALVGGTAGASVEKLIQSLQSDDFTHQAQLFTAAKNARVVGRQIVDGVSTTEYAGSPTAAAALKTLRASFRQALTQELKALGNSPIHFREWVDGQHHLRKIMEIEKVKGDTVDITINVTAINKPVHIKLPPAGQVFALQGSDSGSGNSDTGNLAARVVPAPSGWALSQDPGEPSGPLNAAGFNTYMGQSGLAAALHFVRGYKVFYDNPDGDIIQVDLFQFATQNDVTVFKAGWAPSGQAGSKADPTSPGPWTSTPRPSCRTRPTMPCSGSKGTWRS
jgi:hypothetical protein